MTDDTTLLNAARQGDTEATGTLLEHYAPSVTRFAMKMCRHPEDAEDVLQETLAAAARGLPDFRADASLSTWLFTIARSFCVKKRRKSKYAPEAVVPLDDTGAATVPTSERAPDDAAATREMLEALEHALAALPSEQREVLLLRDVEGLSAAEAAKVLDIGIPALKSRLHRARSALRERMHPFLVPAEAPERLPSCPEIASVFSRYLEGDIASDECAEMEAHIESCAACRASCDSLRQSLSLCRASANREVSPEVQDMVRRAVRALATGATDFGDR